MTSILLVTYFKFQAWTLERADILFNNMPEPIESQYFLSGHVSRTHGVDGTVLIVPIAETAVESFFDEIEIVRLQNERGDLIPARISSAGFKKKDDRIAFFVKFEHINDRNKAEELTGSPVFVEKEEISRFITENDPLVSFDVLNTRNMVLGKVESVIQNPAHPILEVSSKKGKLLIPFVDEYVVDIDESKKLIRCKNTNRLASINDTH